MSSRVCGHGRGLWHQKRFVFGVSQAARLPRFQLNDEAGDEVAVCVHGVFPLPMGMEREDRCYFTGLWTRKGSMAPWWWLLGLWASQCLSH